MKLPLTVRMPGARPTVEIAALITSAVVATQPATTQSASPESSSAPATYNGLNDTDSSAFGSVGLFFFCSWVVHVSRVRRAREGSRQSTHSISGSSVVPDGRPAVVRSETFLTTLRSLRILAAETTLGSSPSGNITLPGAAWHRFKISEIKGDLKSI